MNQTIRRLLYASVLVLLVTGVLYAVPRYADLYFDQDWSPIVSAGLLMKMHGAFALWITVLLGIIWQAHVRLRMHRPFNRPGGFTLAVILALLIISGYLLYYVGARELREIASLAHTVLGVALLVIMVWHASRAKIIHNRLAAQNGLTDLGRGRP